MGLSGIVFWPSHELTIPFFFFLVDCGVTFNLGNLTSLVWSFKILKLSSALITTLHLLQVGLLGEKLQIYMDQGSNRVQWRNFSSAGNPLTWYKVHRLILQELLFSVCNIWMVFTLIFYVTWTYYWILLVKLHLSRFDYVLSDVL